MRTEYGVSLLISILTVLGIYAFMSYSFTTEMAEYQEVVEEYNKGNTEPLTAWRFGRNRDKEPERELRPIRDKDRPRLFNGDRLRKIANGMIWLAFACFLFLLVVNYGVSIIQKRLGV